MKREKAPSAEETQRAPLAVGSREAGKEKRKWEDPTLEDVSKKIMAQPYIRFT